MAFSGKHRLLFAAGAALIASSAQVEAAPCVGITFGADFAADYSCDSLGQPEGIGGPLGGITFIGKNTLLIGGLANGPDGILRTIDVVRDAGNHIISFAGPSSPFATAPYIDGGLAFGPSGVLFTVGYPNNTLLQYLPGSATPDKIITLDPSLASVGTLTFVPSGFGGAGQLKIASYNNGNWTQAALTPDGSGTYDVTTGAPLVTLPGGPEGIVYVLAGNPAFSVDSVIISEWAANTVGVYDIDFNGDPILGTRRDFLTNLAGAEGAVLDPLTGDFIFSTFGGGDQVIVIQGFTKAPPPPVPEPASWALMMLGFGAVGYGMRRAKRRVSVAFG